MCIESFFYVIVHVKLIRLLDSEEVNYFGTEFRTAAFTSTYSIFFFLLAALLFDVLLIYEKGLVISAFLAVF